MLKFNKFVSTIVLLIIFFSFSSCGVYRKVDTRQIPVDSQERARKNVEEGRGASLGNIISGRRNTNYEFSTSNPMWRASLETLDFLPLSVVDYSGGVIVTDWYGDNQKENLKITLRFLSNEVRADSIKIVVHQRICLDNANCNINIFNSKIKDELLVAIIKKAAILEKESKNK
jgi:hypothetical protein